MANSFTEITNQSWFSRLGGSIKGIFVGIILFLIAFPLLFWNEGRSVKRTKTLNEGAGSVVSLASASVDAQHEGHLVHLTGRAETKENLVDSEFDVSVNAIQLRRIVEMYQWKENTKKEETKKVGGGVETKTTYTYEKTWSDSVISSGSFKEPTDHQNPGSMPFESNKWMAGNVTVGGFSLTPGLIGKISNSTAYPVDKLPARMVSQAAQPTGSGVPAESAQSYGQNSGGYGSSTYGSSPTPASSGSNPSQGYGQGGNAYGGSTYGSNTSNQPASQAASQPAAQPISQTQGRFHLFSGGYYIGTTPTSPQIGDLKVRFEVVLPADVSIVAKQVGNTLTTYQAKTGGTIELLDMGTQTAEAMFQSAHSANTMMTWILRLVGFLLMTIGLSSVLKPLSVVADVIPFVGNIVGTGTGLISALLSVGFASITIGVAWIFYRPILGIALVAVSIGAFAAVKKMGAKKTVPTQA